MNLLNKYKEFKNEYLWKRIDLDNYPNKLRHWVWPYQCVDLIKQWSIFLFWRIYETSWNAKQLAWKWRLWKNFEWIPNTLTAIPQPWDVVIWWQWNYWHIAIVWEWSTMYKIVYLEQNWNKWTWDWINWDEIREITKLVWWYRHCLWWQRPIIKETIREYCDENCKCICHNKS